MCSYEDAKAITLRAYELGVNYFDTARIYWDGRSEEVYGDVLPPFRKHIFLTTKSPQRTRQGAEADLEKSLRALKTDHVDLWQIHQVGTLDEVEQIFAPGGAIEAFEAAKKAGKCRFIGFTGHHDPQVHLAMLKKYDKYDSILMPLNPADPSYVSFETNVLPIAVERGMGIQGMKSTANAKLLPHDSLEGLSVVRPQFADSLPRAGLHDHRPDRRRRPDRAAVQATGRRAARADPREGGEVERAAIGRLEDQHRARRREHLPGWRVRVSW